MKKPPAKRAAALKLADDDILPEYDFSRGRPNKYAKLFRPGSQVVVVEPELAALFPSTQAVNDALRAQAGVRRGKARRKARRG